MRAAASGGRSDLFAGVLRWRRVRLRSPERVAKTIFFLCFGRPEAIRPVFSARTMRAPISLGRPEEPSGGRAGNSFSVRDAALSAVRADRSGAAAGPVLARFVRIAGPPAGRTIRALRAAPSSRFPPAFAPSPRHAFHRARSFASALRMIHLFSLFRRLSGMASAMPSVRRLRRTARRFAARAAPSTTPKRKAPDLGKAGQSGLYHCAVFCRSRSRLS